ncbi:MAG: SDR family NAD(P)-dependent oxidoreductase [Erythrobacter sp.]
MALVDRLRLDGKVAVVIGPAKSIGRRFAITLAEAGADVALVSRTQADPSAVAAKIAALCRRALPFAGDATDAGGITDGTPHYLTRTSGRHS